MKYLNVPLALFAGLLGGVLSPYFWPESAQTAVPSVVAAERFVLVGANGQPAGVFAVGDASPKTGSLPSIVLYDAEGDEIWRANASVRPLTVAQ